MAHCIRGPVLSIGRGAATQTTLGCIRAACRAAAEQLGTGYAIEPEAICEGGVRFACWPGKADDDSYKSMRFHGLYGWPLLNGNACDATPLHVEDARLDFFLKAYYGAPPFTVSELEAVASAVAGCFAGSTVERMPSAVALERAYASAPIGLQVPPRSRTIMAETTPIR